MIFAFGLIIGIIYGICWLFTNSSKSAVIGVNVVWTVFCFFVCIGAGSGAGVMLGIWVFVGMIINLCLGGAQKDLSTKENEKKAAKTIDEQNKYDDEWGFIDRKK